MTSAVHFVGVLNKPFSPMGNILMFGQVVGICSIFAFGHWVGIGISLAFGIGVVKAGNPGRLFCAVAVQIFGSMHGSRRSRLTPLWEGV
jgi:hypothetical protein